MTFSEELKQLTLKNNSEIERIKHHLLMAAEDGQSTIEIELEDDGSNSIVFDFLKSEGFVYNYNKYSKLLFVCW